jgi:hypothetical protein
MSLEAVHRTGYPAWQLHGLYFDAGAERVLPVTEHGGAAARIRKAIQAQPSLHVRFANKSCTLSQNELQGAMGEQISRAVPAPETVVLPSRYS